MLMNPNTASFFPEDGPSIVALKNVRVKVRFVPSLFPVIELSVIAGPGAPGSALALCEKVTKPALAGVARARVAAVARKYGRKNPVRMARASFGEGFPPLLTTEARRCTILVLEANVAIRAGDPPAPNRSNGPGSGPADGRESVALFMSPRNRR
jgi:hypothetical protein